MLYLYIKALHIIAVIAWFAGLFYLPRLFVYHVEAMDDISLRRFEVMERRLLHAIMWPAAIVTLCSGLTLLTMQWGYFSTQGWMHIKLLMVLFVMIFHGMCGYYRRRLLQAKDHYRSVYFRFFNEVPTLLLIVIVWLVIVRPF